MVFIFIGVFIELFNLVYYFENKNFDYRLGCGYAIIFSIYVIALILAIIFLIIRKRTSLSLWAFILSAVSNFLFIIWVFVYLYFLYSPDYVYVTDSDAGGGNGYVYFRYDEYDDYPEEKRWRK